MKTTIVFGAAFLCFVLSVMARNIGEGPEQQVASEDKQPSANGSPNNIQIDVNELAKSNAEIAPGAGDAMPTMMMGTKCECAVFNSEFPTESDAPILTHSPFNIGCHCDPASEENCRKLCAGFAEAAKEHGPQLLCTSVGHYNKLRASVHSRVCGAKQWTYTGLTVPDEICCHDHQVINCKDQLENQSPNLL